IHQVECIEPHWDPSLQFNGGMLDLHTLLELRKTAYLGLKSHNFAIRNKGICRLGLEYPDQFRILFIQQFLVARHEPKVFAAKNKLSSGAQRCKSTIATTKTSITRLINPTSTILA